MDVQVRHRLPGRRVLVPADVEAVRSKNLIDFLHHFNDISHHLFLLIFIQVKDPEHMFPGNDDGVPFGMRVDIQESQDIPVFIDFMAGNLPLDDPTKDAVHFEMKREVSFINFVVI